MEKFRIEKADLCHLTEIMGIIRESHQGMEQKDWFAADEEGFIRDILTEDGFIIGAWEEKTGEMAGYFSVVFPDSKDNMGKYAGLSEEELSHVVYLDSAAVKKTYRGNGLQSKMLEAAEKELTEIQKSKGAACQYRMCTVHPENRYSLENMMQNGYKILARTELYGGLDRYILGKTVSL